MKKLLKSLIEFTTVIFFFNIMLSFYFELGVMIISLFNYKSNFIFLNFMYIYDVFNYFFFKTKNYNFYFLSNFNTQHC